MGAHPAMSIATDPDGKPLAWEDAVQGARREAETRGFAKLYAVDRTAGRREQAIIGRGGDHSTPRRRPQRYGRGRRRSPASTILDRGHDAGFMR